MGEKGHIAGTRGGPHRERGAKLGDGDSKLVVRTLTGAVAIPVVVAVVLLGGPLYIAVIGAAAVVAVWEAYHMLRLRGSRPAPLALPLAALLAVSRAFTAPEVWWTGLLLIGMMTAAVWFLASWRSDESFLDWAMTVLIALYTGGLLGSLIAVRRLDDGVRLVLLVLILTWAYDTGAFFAGRLWGRRPFMSNVSKSKTWEGVLGGFVLCVGLALAAAVPCQVSLGVSGLLAVATAVAAQSGDLLESLLKRYCHVKDSGAIVPGHGGLLDRIDGLLFTGTVAYYVFLAAGFR